MVYLLLEIHVFYWHDVGISLLLGRVRAQVTYAVEKFAHFLDFSDLRFVNIVDIIFFLAIQLLVRDHLRLLRLDDCLNRHDQLCVILGDTYQKSQIFELLVGYGVSLRSLLGCLRLLDNIGLRLLLNFVMIG